LLTDFIFFSSPHKTKLELDLDETKPHPPNQLQLELCTPFATNFPTIMATLRTPQHIANQKQTGSTKKQSSEPTTSKFPARLRKMLNDAEENDFSDVVSWNSDGLSFRVHKTTEFADKIMTTYFNQTKYKSFQRQLNHYGFVRIQQGYHKASYANKKFHREDPSLSLLRRHQITRNIAKNTPATTCLHGHSHSLSMSAFDDMLVILDFEAKPSSLVGRSIADTFLAEPVVVDDACLSGVRLVNKDLFDTGDIAVDAGGVINDFSNDPLFQSMMNDPILLSLERKKSASDLIIDNAEEKIQVEVSTRKTKHHSFPWKLHDMLEEAESNNFSHIVSWEPGDDVSFKVHKIDEFFTEIMPLYFDQTKYDSFRRQLDLYSFSRVTQGSNSGIYFHTKLVKGDRSLCKEIRRS
jgi:hypothetical protein